MPLNAMEFAAMRAKAGDGRWLCFDVVFVLKLLPVKFSEAGEIQDASHLRISDVKNPRQPMTARGLIYKVRPDKTGRRAFQAQYRYFRAKRRCRNQRMPS